MWRALFLALGISAILLGAEGLVVERALLHAGQPAAQAAPGQFRAAAPPARRDFLTPEWAPWCFLSVGAVVVLYTLTIAKSGS